MARAIPEGLASSSGTAFDSLFNNSKHSDVTIYLGESKIPFAAHRVVLGTRCPYFDDIFQSGFKEGIINEISFEKDSPHALWRVLCYIYTGNYSDGPSEASHSERDDLELFKHPRVFALADMFRIEELKHWISDTFPDSIREVYSTSNNTDSDSIRNIVVGVVPSHKQDLL
ncbi:POZ domain-containing protein [Hyaloscypha variabilis F]|uniref:POZ domain-containing protein n=1 Tax=Hyaloscypha variabilis (strain UAMH 11265 / GT02V1 / F) TaxID=1149755 RepID=A0A2J6RT88_HYAVF|nr:POZ domain-containing protein [Hyaloscypha variabilis F]